MCNFGVQEGEKNLADSQKKALSFDICFLELLRSVLLWC